MSECYMTIEVHIRVPTSVFYKIMDRLLDAGQACLVAGGRMPSTAGKLYRHCADLFDSKVRIELAQAADLQVVYVVLDRDLDMPQPYQVTSTGVEPPVGYRRKSNGRFTGWPSEWTDRHYNGIKEPCDMLSGPCCCGAWHYAEEPWVKEALARHGVTIEDV